MTDDHVAARIARDVDRLFEEDRKKHYGQRWDIPIVGGSYVPGELDERHLHDKTVKR